MTERDGNGLRLQAADAEDFKVIAACLQDSVLRLGEMTYLSEEKRFVAVLDRFVWERSTGIKGKGMDGDLLQVQSGLCFNGITSVHVHGIDQHRKDEILELLTIAFESGTVTLVFAGRAAVKLEGEAIVCFLEDLGAPRPSAFSPCHPIRPLP